MKNKLLSLSVITSLCAGSMFLSQCKKECAQGYTGRKCDEQKTPTSITITKVTVNSFCNGCDPDEAQPDIYIDITDENNNVLYTGVNSNYSNVTSGTGSWYWNPNITINPSLQYKMKLYDDEGILTDDLLHSCIFSPYSSGERFPSSKTHSCSPFSFTNSLTYAW